MKAHLMQTYEQSHTDHKPPGVTVLQCLCKEGNHKACPGNPWVCRKVTAQVYLDGLLVIHTSNHMGTLPDTPNPPHGTSQRQILIDPRELEIPPSHGERPKKPNSNKNQ